MYKIIGTHLNISCNKLKFTRVHHIGICIRYMRYYNNKHQIKSQTTLNLPTAFGLSFSNADGDTSISFILQASHLSLTVTMTDFDVVGSIIFTRLPHMGSKLGFGAVKWPKAIAATMSLSAYTWPHAVNPNL